MKLNIKKLSENERIVVLNRSTIRANAFEGNGGKIEITGKDVLISSGTIIEASSEKGIDGEILVSSPDSDLITDLVTLRTNFLDASSLLAQSCSARTARAGSLVVRGRDRIPAAPADAPLRGFYLGGDEPPAVSSARSKFRRVPFIGHVMPAPPRRNLR